MNIATVLLNSDPVSMIRRQSGIISVVSRKFMTSDESFLTSAPITPREVSRRYSNGRDLEVVLRKGYKKRGICAECVSKSHENSSIVYVPFRKSARVSL